MFSHLRRIPLAALAVETSLAEGEQALQARLQCASEQGGTRAAHEAEKGLVTRLMPRGVAAMKRSCAPRGTGAGGPAVTRADGILLPREPKRRGRADGALFGTCTVARTGSRTPGEAGRFPLDAQVNRPTRGDAYVLPAWMTVCAVEPPVTARASWFEPLVALEVAESAVMAVAQEAPEA
jgi:hypothetical protein